MRHGKTGKQPGENFGLRGSPPGAMCPVAPALDLKAVPDTACFPKAFAFPNIRNAYLAAYRECDDNLAKLRLSEGARVHNRRPGTASCSNFNAKTAQIHEG
jgi:hypothetical protein